MSTKSDKQRIVALQKALRIARQALERCQHNGRSDHIEDALYEIDKLDWNSKPDLSMERRP